MADLRQREPRERDTPYMLWIKGLWCVRCAVLQGRFVTPCDAAHVRMACAEAGWEEAGMQRKPDDRRTLPLCPSCHRPGYPGSQHSVGDEGLFWRQIGILPWVLCADLHACFDAGKSAMDARILLASKAGAARQMRAH